MRANAVSQARAGLLIPPLWVEEAETSFNYVTSTQPLHPDDTEQPTGPPFPART